MFSHLLKLMWNKRRANGLLFLEILLAFIVLFGVLGFCFFNLDRYASPLGFDYENTWQVDLDIPDDLDSAGNRQLQELILREVRSLPGVEDATFMGYVTPFGGSTWRSGGDISGQDISAMIMFADEHYARAAKVDIREGRWFQLEDKNAKTGTMVINKAFNDRYAPPGGSFLDSVITYNGMERKVIGVTGDFKYHSNFQANEPLVFLYDRYLDDADDPLEALMVRVGPNVPASLEEDIYKLVSQLTKSPDTTINRLARLRTFANRPITIPMTILIIISGFLLINIALGLFGVLFTQINRRRSEIGLRKAMGATGPEVTRQFIMETLIVTLGGLLVGTFFAIQVPLLNLLPIDDRFFYWGILGAIGIILLIVLICAAIPSSLASKLHPADVLHED
ncbi:MAG: FtsX-like permease family protein [Bacteroidota bacterium]